MRLAIAQRRVARINTALAEIERYLSESDSLECANDVQLSRDTALVTHRPASLSWILWRATTRIMHGNAYRLRRRWRRLRQVLARLREEIRDMKRMSNASRRERSRA